MVGIMGPSGCGKTSLLDLLTGRRKTGYIKVRLDSESVNVGIPPLDKSLCVHNICSHVLRPFPVYIEKIVEPGG